MKVREVSLRPGDALRVDHHGVHPAVVLWVKDPAVLVVCGTSRAYPGRDEVVVHPRSPAATVLELPATTYFPSRGIAAITDPLLVVRVLGRRVPPQILHALELLVEKATSSFPNQTADLIKDLLDHMAAAGRAAREAKEAASQVQAKVRDDG
jgi:hypothetical protein